MAGELQKTMEKGNPPPGTGKDDKKSGGLLAQAQQAISRLKSGIASSHERMEIVGDMMIATVETTTTNFIGSTAEGYWGKDRLKLGPVDMRLVGGLALGTLGVYKGMNGKGGSHELALGNGLVQSVVSSAGRDAGQALRERGNGAGNGGAGGAGNGAGGLQEGAIIEQGGKKYRVTNGAMVEFSGSADVEGIVRDIGARLQISPPDEGEGDENGARGRHGRGRKRPRDFVPVRAR